MTTSSLPIRQTLLYLMADNSKLRRAKIQTRLEAIGLHRGQQFILAALWEQEGLTHSELAELLIVTPATITNGLKRMEKAGLVERRPDPKDQRISRVYLTQVAWKVRERVEAIWHQFEADVLTGFSDEEKAILRELELRMKKNLLT